MRFKTVLFDLDGTLLDHVPAIHRAYRHTLAQLGRPAPTREQVRRAIGGGLEKAMLDFMTPAELPRGLEIYRAYWEKTMLDGVTLIPGAAELLRALRGQGCVLAVFTNKHGPSSRKVCAHLGISDFFKGIYGAHDTPWLKPDPAFATHVLKELGADAATTCLVGDSPFDAEAGRNAGFPVFLVTTGSHSAAELRAAKADHIHPDLFTLAREAFALELGAKRTA